MSPILIAAALVASPSFPEVIQQQLSLPAPPRCTICHATASGGEGTVVTPFGLYLRSRGLVEGDADSLRNALRADVGEDHSSDGRTADIAALEAGLDPNGERSVPSYGCASAAPDLIGLLALGAWLYARGYRRLLHKRSSFTGRGPDRRASWRRGGRDRGRA